MGQRVSLVDQPLAEPADVGLAGDLRDDGWTAGELRLGQDGPGHREVGEDRLITHLGLRLLRLVGDQPDMAPVTRSGRPSPC